MALMQAEPEPYTAPYPEPGSRVEECWMDFDGTRMRYLRTGSGPALILLHGLLGYSFSWRYTMPALAPYATIYAPDMIGAGFSDRTDAIDYSMSGTAKRLLQFIKRLGISSFDLLGTSHGGAVSMVAAAQCLEGEARPRLRKLVLVAPVNPYSAHGRRLAPFAASSLGSVLFRYGVFRLSFTYPLVHARLYASRRTIPRGALEGYVAPVAKPGFFNHALSIVRTWKEDLRELEAALPKLAGIPTLLVWGDKDPAVYVSSARPLQNHFPKSKLVIFPGIGHLAYEECPDEFNQVLMEFLANG